MTEPEARCIHLLSCLQWLPLLCRLEFVLRSSCRFHDDVCTVTRSDNSPQMRPCRVSKRRQNPACRQCISPPSASPLSPPIAAHKTRDFHVQCVQGAAPPWTCCW